jgi:hypothetical protein
MSFLKLAGFIPYLTKLPPGFTRADPEALVDLEGKVLISLPLFDLVLSLAPDW